jgi:hypothetical protein
MYRQWHASIVAKLGIRLDGSTNGKIQFTYKAVERIYVQGNILHNFNGSDYRVIKKFSARNLLLMDVNKGNMLVAIGTGTYKRYPKDEIPMKDIDMLYFHFNTDNFVAPQQECTVTKYRGGEPIYPSLKEICTISLGDVQSYFLKNYMMNYAYL